jgi:hypothetical protein
LADQEFGFVLPIVIDATNRVIAGWGLALAAKRLGLPEVLGLPSQAALCPRRPKLVLMQVAMIAASDSVQLGNDVVDR